MKKKKPQITIDAEQARHYWKSAAAAVTNNPTVFEDISRTMDGEVKKSGKIIKKEEKPAPKQPEDHNETIQTFLNSWFLHEYVFRARYMGHPCVLDMYPHRLSWGYPWQFLLEESSSRAEEGHRYVSIPMVNETLYISVWNNIKEEIEAQYPDEPVTAEWILYRVFAHLPKNTPLLDFERAQIEEDFRREQ